MSSKNSLVSLAVDAFCESVADPRSAVPAGGSVAALNGALGASLVSMAFRVAANEPGRKNGAYMEGRAEELDDLRDLLVELVDRDAESYRRYVATRDAEPEKKEKAELEALEAPMETAEFSLAALRLLSVGRSTVPTRLDADCDVALRSLVAAVEGGLAVAEVNLAGRPAGPARDDLAGTIAAVRAEAGALAGGLAAAAAEGSKEPSS